MKLLVRLVILLLVVPATYYFIYWALFSLLPVGENPWIATLVSLVCAVGVGWFVWSKLAISHQGLISSVLLGAVVLGGTGFTAGFFGPIVFMPEANQGPLIGIFFTGPLGFVAGGIAGFVYWAFKVRKHHDNRNAT